MITQPAKVLETFDTYCVVETIPKSACPRCAEGKGCAGGILAQAFANKIYQIHVSYNNHDEQETKRPAIGTQVTIAMSSNGLLLASMVMYLVPLMMMIFSALLTSIYLSNADGYTTSAALIGLLSGALMASKLSRLLIISGVTQAQMIPTDKNNCWHSV